MIQGRCRTNLDDFAREQWPTVFVAVPRVGEWVESVSSYPITRRKLRVCSVTHFMENVGKDVYAKYEPRIEVELNK